MMSNIPVRGIFKVSLFALETWFFKVTATLCYDFAFNQSLSFTGFFVFMVCFIYSMVYITHVFLLIYCLNIPEWVSSQKRE